MFLPFFTYRDEVMVCYISSVAFCDLLQWVRSAGHHRVWNGLPSYGNSSIPRTLDEGALKD